MLTGISVIICCFNSATRITPTLQRLARQENISFSNCEIILVDNGSTDDTAQKASAVWDSLDMLKPPFKIVTESTPGLTSARLKGIEASVFNYILFCDDDNWLDSNYLSIAVQVMESNPAIGALGGTGSPVFEDKEPPYFWVNQYHALAVGEQSKIDGDITNERGVLYGAGMILNKNAFKKLREEFKFEFVLTDRIGNSLVSSGDHELCLALRKIGYKIFYSKSLKFEHFIPKNRTTIHYYKRLFLGFGVSYALLHIYRINKKNVNDIRNDYRYICMRGIKNIITATGKLVFKGYHFSANKYKYVDDLHQLYNNIGILHTFLKVGNTFKKKFANYSLFISDK